MRGAFLHFLVLVAVICGGHAPALAHDDHGAFGEFGAHAVDHSHDAELLADEGPDSHSEPAKEIFHHHHCQMVMASVGSAGSAPAFIKRDMLRHGHDAALPSRALSPPLDPPIA